MSRLNCIDEIALSAYLDGELGEDAVREVEQHLAACQDCSASFQRMRSHCGLLIESLPNALPPAHVKAQLFCRIDAERDQTQVSGIGAWTAGIRSLLTARSRAWALACASFVLFAVALSAVQIQRHIEDGKMLAQIDLFKAELISRDKTGNPFNIDLNGAPLRTAAAENPFKAYLSER